MEAVAALASAACTVSSTTRSGGSPAYRLTSIVQPLLACADRMPSLRWLSPSTAATGPSRASGPMAKEWILTFIRLARSAATGGDRFGPSPATAPAGILNADLFAALARGEVGVILGEEVRGADKAARLGGDEFVVLLEDCALLDACSIAENVRKAIEAYEYRGSHGPHRIEVMDTTLRDGEQTPEISYTPTEKLQIARTLSGRRTAAA